jgi:UDP-N-acetylglucosamine transferase subunit ALG13
MIFVTVGEQLPFDRLIQAVDEWASTSKKEIFAQIGKSSYIPQHISYKKFLTPEEFKKNFVAAEFVIGHAGMGTIIFAVEQSKPIVVMPRQAERGEHRNNHQLATAKRFLELNYISVAFDEIQLKVILNNPSKFLNSQKMHQESGPSSLLIKTIQDFINADE